MKLHVPPKLITFSWNTRWRVDAVLSLLFTRGPAAVTWLVVAIVVVALDGVALAGTLAHVGEECGELQPSLTDFDAAPAVAVEMLSGFWIGTARNHRYPRTIRQRSGPSIRGMAVLGRAIDLKASTTSMMARSKIATASYSHLSAITLESPDRSIPATSCALNNDQSFETLSCQVNHGWHDVEVIIHG